MGQYFWAAINGRTMLLKIWEKCASWSNNPLAVYKEQHYTFDGNRRFTNICNLYYVLDPGWVLCTITKKHDTRRIE